MGAIGARTIPFLLVLSMTAPAAAWHEPEMPVQHEVRSPHGGWFAAHITPGGDRITAEAQAVSSGPILLQVILLDANGTRLASGQMLAEDSATYVRVAGFPLEREPRLPSILVSGMRFAGSYTAECEARGSVWGSTNGTFGTSITVPTDCAGHAVGGVIISAVGDALGGITYRLRSNESIAVGGTVLSDDGGLLDASEFDGIAIEVTSTNVVLGDYAYGNAMNATHEVVVERELFGMFDGSRWSASHPARLSWEHAGSSGACRCVWSGGDSTSGAWTFRLDGAHNDRNYLGYIDAALPD